MGYGSWSDAAYTSLSTSRKASKGVSAFTHTADINAGRTAAKAHDRLSPFGVTARESRDSDEHPNSNAIGVLFDVTGSMGRIPRVLQEKLPKLMSTLLLKGYLPDPQILFGAVGDATCDRVPLQVGQFESDVNMDEDVDKIYLEGGGGGQFSESYELGMYFMARHTSIDCLEKRGKKGYLFLIGDEEAYRSVKKREVDKVIGENTIQEDIPIKEIAEELQEKYEVFFIIPTSSHYGRKNKPFWTDIFGQNVIELDNPDLVCELIVTTIGVAEGYIDNAGDVINDLGLSDKEGKSLSTALAVYTDGRRSLAKVDGGELVSSGAGSVTTF